MDKQAKTGTVLHLAVLDAGSVQTLNICIRPNDDFSVLNINLNCSQVILDSGLQLIRGIPTTCLVPVQKPLLELDRIKLLARFSLKRYRVRHRKRQPTM